MAEKTHPLVAPPTDARSVRRLGKNGRWTDCPDPSKAKPARAFIGLLDKNGASLRTHTKRAMHAFAIVAECDCAYADCVVPIALDAACMLNGVASVLRRPAVE